MFSLGEPSGKEIAGFLREQRDAPFSYDEVGASRDGDPRGVPPGYVVDRYGVRLGEGEEIFGRAADALRAWRMFDTGWTRVHPPDAPAEPCATVAVLARHHGFWSLNAARVVYRAEEGGDVEKRGFAYGTLPGHAARGEERFVVSWDRRDGSVSYEVLAFSRPGHPMARAGYPLARALQRRFARDSKRAMVAACRRVPTLGLSLRGPWTESPARQKENGPGRDSEEVSGCA